MGDVSVEAGDSSAASLRLAAAFAVTVSVPMPGAEPAVSMVMRISMSAACHRPPYA